MRGRLSRRNLLLSNLESAAVLKPDEWDKRQKTPPPDKLLGRAGPGVRSSVVLTGTRRDHARPTLRVEDKAGKQAEGAGGRSKDMSEKQQGARDAIDRPKRQQKKVRPVRSRTLGLRARLTEGELRKGRTDTRN